MHSVFASSQEKDFFGNLPLIHEEGCVVNQINMSAIACCAVAEDIFNNDLQGVPIRQGNICKEAFFGAVAKLGQ